MLEHDAGPGRALHRGALGKIEGQLKGTVGEGRANIGRALKRELQEGFLLQPRGL